MRHAPIAASNDIGMTTRVVYKGRHDGGAGGPAVLVVNFKNGFLFTKFFAHCDDV